MNIRAILAACVTFGVISIPALAVDELQPVKVEAKKSVGVFSPKPGLHTCSVTNMPANSACAGTINQGTWEAMIQYAYMDMSTKYTGSTVVANPNNDKMSMSMTMTMLSYGVSDSMSLSVMIPTVAESMTMTMMGTTTTTSTSGLGDISVSGKWRIWSDGDITTPPKSFDDLRDSGNSVAFMATVKTPTGDNNTKDNTGARISDSMQLGTGSWDERVGISYSRNMNPFWVHASVFYGLNGTNSFGYQFGNKTSYNLAFQFEPFSNAVLGLELNGDTRDANTQNGVVQANTGGSKLMLTPSIQYQWGDNWDIQLGYQTPVSQSVNGTTFGVTNGWFVGLRGTL